jgi:ferritin-like protein
VKSNTKVALKILRNEIKHERVVTNAFERSSIGLYDDIYSSPGQKKYYVVKNVLSKAFVTTLSCLISFRKIFRATFVFDFTCGKVNPKVALKILRNEIQHERVVTNAFERTFLTT